MSANKFILLVLVVFLALGQSACRMNPSRETIQMSIENSPTTQVESVLVEITPIMIEPLPVGNYEPGLEETLKPWTTENPMKDAGEIQTILQKLLFRYLDQFSEAGWYHLHDISGTSYWVHIPVGGSDIFDQFICLRQCKSYAPGFILPGELLLADGSWGISQITAGLDDYYFISAGRQVAVETRLQNLESYTGSNVLSGYFGITSLILFNDRVSNPNDPKYSTLNSVVEFSAWVEPYEGRDVFVLLFQSTFASPKPRLATGESIDSEESYTFFSLENGGRIADETICYLEGGGIAENGLRFDQHLVEYYEFLPVDVQAIYDKAEKKLRDYLADQ
jgi:hypothetical protein